MNIDLTFSREQLLFLDSKAKYVIVTKGRRFGATRAVANQFILDCIEGVAPLLWVDTINGNIDRYFERYFLPALKQNNIPFDFNQQKKILKIFNGYIDFRSADNPQSLEGFGYKKIFLNEAGIILKNEYLYTNAILPMLMDYPDSQLIAAGVPKGKFLKTGGEHPFFVLYNRGKEGQKDYEVFEFTSYDNPFLRQEDVQSLEDEMRSMNELQVQQEIYGKFIEYSGNNPFLYNYKDNFVQTVNIDPKRQIIFGIDFNINPFCCVVAQTDFVSFLHIVDEIAIDNGNMTNMIDFIKRNYAPYLRTCLITGDAMGKNRNITLKDNHSNYDMLQHGLGLNHRQIVVQSNPTHDNSRADCNYFCEFFPLIKISDKCTGLIKDLKYVQCDNKGSIVKQNRSVEIQQSDYTDIFRYFVNNFFKDWIQKDRRRRKIN